MRSNKALSLIIALAITGCGGVGVINPKAKPANQPHAGTPPTTTKAEDAAHTVENALQSKSIDELKNDLDGQQKTIAAEKGFISKRQAELKKATKSNSFYKIVAPASTITTGAMFVASMYSGADYIEGLSVKAQERATMELFAESQKIGLARAEELVKNNPGYREQMLKEHAVKMSNDPYFYGREFEARVAEKVKSYRATVEAYNAPKLKALAEAEAKGELATVESLKLSLGDMDKLLANIAKDQRAKLAIEESTGATTQTAAKRYFEREIEEVMKTAGSKASFKGVLFIGGALAVGVVVTAGTNHEFWMTEKQMKQYSSEIEAANKRCEDSQAVVDSLIDELAKRGVKIPE